MRPTALFSDQVLVLLIEKNRSICTRWKISIQKEDQNACVWHLIQFVRLCRVTVLIHWDLPPLCRFKCYVT
jgi:hypothetical protein